jgi:ribosome-associated heat shock protein Hsp15
VLTFSQGTRIRVVRIKALGARRGSASEAALLYDDLAPVMPATENSKPAAMLAFEERQVGGGRPTKRQRRETDRLKAGILDSED